MSLKAEARKNPEFSRICFDNTIRVRTEADGAWRMDFEALAAELPANPIPRGLNRAGRRFSCRPGEATPAVMRS